jgi:hypothetical protein
MHTRVPLCVIVIGEPRASPESRLNCITMSHSRSRDPLSRMRFTHVFHPLAVLLRLQCLGLGRSRPNGPTCEGELTHQISFR